MNPANFRKRVSVLKPQRVEDGAVITTTFVHSFYMRADIKVLTGAGIREALEGDQNETVATHAIGYNRRDQPIARDDRIEVVDPPSDGRLFTVTMESPPNDPRWKYVVHCKERTS